MPLLWLSLAFLLGICLSASLLLAESAWLYLAAAALAPGLLPLFIPRLNPYSSKFSNHIPLFPYSLLPLFIFLGAARYQAVQPPPADPGFIASFNDREVVSAVDGVLVEPPDLRDTFTYLRLKVERLCFPDSSECFPVHGLLLAQVPTGGEWRYGDRLAVEGSLETPPEREDFSFRETLARQGVYSYMGYARARRLGPGQGNPLLAAVYALRDRALQTVYRIYPDPEASLLAGILLGVESGIPKPVQDAFKATGTAHIIAISGFNFAVIAGMFSTLFGRLLGTRRRFLAAGMSAGCIAAYALLVGGSASVVRAAFMGGLSLFARQIGRRQDGLNSLAFVAALMAAFHPHSLWEPGFQLSFAATLGLVLYAEPLSSGFQRLVTDRWSPAAAQRLSRPISEYLLFTLAAQVTTLPVIVYHFQLLSLSGLIANPLVLPVQPAVMILGGLAVLLGLIWLPLGQLAAYLAWPFAAFTLRVVELLDRLPGGELKTGPSGLLGAILFYGLLFGLTLGCPRLRRLDLGSLLAAVRSGSLAPRLQALAAGVRPPLILAGLGLAAVVVWRLALSAPDGRLHLTVLDVGGGEALLVQTPGGRSLLVNGGRQTSLLSAGLGRHLPLSNRRLDWLVVAGAENEQLSALPRSLERFPVGSVLWAAPSAEGRAARDLQEYLSREQAPVVQALAGQALELGEGAFLRVLAVGEDGAVLALEWKNFRALLPVGLDPDVLQALQDDPGLAPVDALLLAGGGSAELNPPDWIARLGPKVALLSVGAGNLSRLPNPAALEAVQGHTLARTDRNGWIQVTTDGERMWVEVERK